MDETIYCKVIYSKGSYNKIRYLKLEDIDDIYDMIKMDIIYIFMK